MANCCNDENVATYKSVGIIKYVDPLDNCGAYMFIADDRYYKPDNLPDEYKVDELQVEISYQMTDLTHNCGFGGYKPVIKIIKIKKL